MKTEEKRILGKRSRRAGLDFELRVRKWLEEWHGLVVTKWHNDIDLEKKKVIPAKRAFFRGRPLTVNTGFPDLLAYKFLKDDKAIVYGIEVKSNGKLTKTEKDKLSLYKELGIFSEVFVASKGEKGAIELAIWTPT